MHMYAPVSASSNKQRKHLFGFILALEKFLDEQLAFIMTAEAFETSAKQAILR